MSANRLKLNPKQNCCELDPDRLSKLTGSGLRFEFDTEVIDALGSACLFGPRSDIHAKFISGKAMYSSSDKVFFFEQHQCDVYDANST